MNDNLNKLLDQLLATEARLSADPAAKKLFGYNKGAKIHLKQMQFHKCTKRNRWVFGGNRSGKSECGAVETIWLARGIHPYRKNQPTDGWVVSLSFNVQKAVAQKKILSFLPREWIADITMREGKRGALENGIIDTISVKNIFGSISHITFKSAEEGREKFQGASLNYVWFDEEPPEDVWAECCMRVLDRAGDIYATMTPLKGLTFVYHKIYLNPSGDPETYCMFITWADNPFLPPSEVARMEATLSKDELDARREGRFLEKEQGLVYREFDPSVHIIEPFNVPPDWQAGISIDPGLNNPLSCHFYAVDWDGNIYVVAEHYKAGESVEWHAARIKELAATLNWRVGRSGKLEAMIDSAANQKTLASSKSVTELFFENGIAVSPRVNKDVFSGINKVKSYLKDDNGRARLFIFSCCTNMIREFKTYSWGAGDSPRKVDDHSMDELRYFIMSRPETKAATEHKSAVLLEKERLIRRNRRKYM